MSEWREDSVKKQNKHMLLTGFRSDCTFLVGQGEDTKEFHAHKIILSRSSDVFEVMFYGALSENDVVRVTDITPAAFQALLYHVYCDILEVSDVDMAIDVCSAADKYHIQPLVNKCLQYFKEYMSIDNIWQLFDFSNLIKDTSLKQHCTNMLQTRTDEVLKADSWCDVDVSVIVTLLQQDTLNVQSELTLLTACQRWAQHNLNNQQDYDVEQNKKCKAAFTKMKSLLRVLSVTRDEWLLVMADNIMLYSKDEQFDILRCIMEPEIYKLPVGMCENSTPRILPTDSDKDENVMEKLKVHLNQVSYSRQKFKLYLKTLTREISVSTIYILKLNIAIYGFQFHAFEYDQEDNIHRVFAKNGEHIEKFTLEFFHSGKCVGIFKFDGKLKYGSKTDFFFPKPFLARKNREYVIKLTFNHDESRNYPSYHYKLNTSLEHCTFVWQFDFCCLSQIIYKEI